MVPLGAAFQTGCRIWLLAAALAGVTPQSWAAAAQKLGVIFPSKDQVPGDMILSAKVAGFRNVTKGMAKLGVTLAPDIPSVIGERWVRYTIQEGALLVHVPFRRANVPVRFTLTLEIPDAGDHLHSFIAEGRTPGLGSVTAAPPKQEKTLAEPPPSLRSSPFVLRNPVVSAVTEAGGGAFHWELRFSASGKSRLRMIVKSDLGAQYEQLVDAADGEQTVALVGPAFEHGTLEIHEQNPAAARVGERLLNTMRFAKERSPWRSTLLLAIAALTLVTIVGFAVFLVYHRRAVRRSAGTLKPTHADFPFAFNPRLEKDTEILHKRVDELHSIVTERHRPAREDTVEEVRMLTDWLAVRDQVAQQKAADQRVQATGEVSLVAAANHWLETGRSDRDEVPGMLLGLRIKAKWYQHMDLTRLFADLGQHSYKFEPSERNGGWLWLDLPASEALALPADASYFHLGLAPGLLERLFDGIQSPGEGFRFAKFYKPCRLKRTSGNSNDYSLVGKGVLQLAGTPAPDLPPPASYDAVRRTLPPEDTSLSLASLVRRTIERLEREMEVIRFRTDPQLRRPDSQARGPRDEGRQGAQPLLAAEIRKEVETHEKRLADLERGVENIRAALNRATPMSQARPEAGLEPLRATGAGKPPPRQFSGVERAQREALPLPEDWQDLLDRAARDKESQLKPNQLSTDNYLSRLHRLRYYFDEYLRKRTKSSSIPGRVIHMLYQDGRFAVHDTHTIGDPPARSCMICGETVPFPQLVLCFGGHGAETLHVLLPYGAYIRSNYPKLYQLALSNPPDEECFEINGIQSPAVLRRGSERSGPYEIVERMRWSR